MISEYKALVIGCGSIGKRHIRNLKTVGVRDFVLCDVNRAAAQAAAEGLISPTIVTDFKEALKSKPHVAVICTPSSMHLEMASELVRNGVHVLIEKPLSHTIEGCEALERLVRENGVIAMMAMCYRFHPVFAHIKNLLDSQVVGKIYHVNYFGGHYLPDWHPKADYRKEYAAQRRLGGGVVLTSIHGLDNLRFLFGEVAELHAFADKVSALEMDVEDIALGIFRMESGAYVSWSTDFLQRANQHRMVIAGEKGSIRADFVEGVVDTYIPDFGKWYTGRLSYDANDMYVSELKYFFECIEKKVVPAMSVREGINTLKLALKIKETQRTVESERLCIPA